MKDVLVAETRSPCFSRFFVNLSVAILWERYESNEHARKAADKIAYRELHPDEVSECAPMPSNPATMFWHPRRREKDGWRRCLRHFQ